MQWHQGGFSGASISIAGFGAVQSRTLHLFGDLTWQNLLNGQVWRLVTATFLHASLPHLVLNLIGMVQLGRLVEPWYGARQFLAICLGLGSLGNLAGMMMRQGAAAVRVWLQAHGLNLAVPGGLANGGGPAFAAQVTSVGGSIIILGLCGLSLVVGWRSRTRVGAFLRDQMIGILVFIALIGIVGIHIVDNFGHAGGALVGAAAGFLHRPLFRTERHGPTRRILGVIVVAVLAASIGCQVVTARRMIATSRAAAAEGLVRLLPDLRTASEIIAAGRFLAGLDRAVGLADPTLAVGLDPTPVFELRTLGINPPLRSQQLAMLVEALNRLNRLRIEVDPNLGGTEIDELLRLGAALAAGPLDSREMYELRVDREVLFRRAQRVLAESGTR
jgi:membrane associated rhomboid family serine protease